jgi:hypothetical protein
MKLKYILENKILIPRRSKEERSKNLAAVHYKQIQEYIKNGSEGSLDLTDTPLKILPPNLTRVGGKFNLYNSQITSLNNLEHVGWSLDLEDTQITSLGNLNYVGNNLWLQNTPISKTHTEEQIRKQVKIMGGIYS